MVCKGHIRQKVLWTISMMLLNEGNDVGAKDLAVDLPIDREIRNGKKKSVTLSRGLHWLFACFDIRLLGVYSFDF